MKRCIADRAALTPEWRRLQPLVVILQEELASFDCLEWLGSGLLAAELLCCNQATISRHSQRVRAQLALEFQRNERGLVVTGRQQELLRLERQIHQLFRFRGRGLLRLQVPAAGDAHLRRRLPAGWCCSPRRRTEAWVQPQQLLENHIVDACIVQRPQLAQLQSDAFWVVELFRSPLQLVALDDHPISRQQGLSAGDLAAQTRLIQLPFLPETTHRALEALHQSLTGAAAPAAPDPAAAPVTYVHALALQLPRYQPLSVPIGRETADYLVCLKEHRHQGALQQLLEALQQSLRMMQASGLALQLNF